jgi:hypothetical protein
MVDMEAEKVYKDLKPSEVIEIAKKLEVGQMKPIKLQHSDGIYDYYIELVEKTDNKIVVAITTGDPEAEYNVEIEVDEGSFYAKVYVGLAWVWVPKRELDKYTVNWLTEISDIATRDGNTCILDLI